MSRLLGSVLVAGDDLVENRPVERKCSAPRPWRCRGHLERRPEHGAKDAAEVGEELVVA
jgi:hypothetical protein